MSPYERLQEVINELNEVSPESVVDLRVEEDRGENRNIQAKQFIIEYKIIK